jgi:hypothetical protein
MKKAKKAARSIKPLGRNPVISVRISQPLHDRITATAAARGQSMSETMADLLRTGLDWQQAFGDRMAWFKREREEISRILDGDLKAGALSRGWTTVYGPGGLECLAPPGSLAKQTHWLTPEEIKAEIKAEIDASLDRIEERVRAGNKGGN